MNNYLEQWQAGVDLELKKGDKVGLLTGEIGFVAHECDAGAGNYSITTDDGATMFETLKDGRLILTITGDEPVTKLPIIYPMKKWYMVKPTVIERRIDEGELVWAWNESKKDKGSIGFYLGDKQSKTGAISHHITNSCEQDFLSGILGNNSFDFVEKYDKEKHRVTVKGISKHGASDE